MRMCLWTVKPFATAAKTISLSTGKHVVVVLNYGYKISTQDVNIDSGKTTDLNVYARGPMAVL